MKSIKILGNNYGFFSCLLTTLDNILYCEEQGYKFNIEWTGYLYYNGSNTFTNYFEPLEEQITYFDEVSDTKTFLLDRFTQLVKDVDKDLVLKDTLNKLIHKYFKPLPHIKEKVDNFINENFSEPTTGIHIRGTDFEARFYTPTKPYNDYDYIYNILKDIPNKIYIASDHQDVVDFLKNKLGDKVIYRDIKRSPTLTSPALHADLNTNNYTKGEDAMLDMLLLSRCDKIMCKGSNLPLTSALWNTNAKIEQYDI